MQLTQRPALAFSNSDVSYARNPPAVTSNHLKRQSPAQLHAGAQQLPALQQGACEWESSTAVWSTLQLKAGQPHASVRM
jgi:hypothetical protein